MALPYTQISMQSRLLLRKISQTQAQICHVCYQKYIFSNQPSTLGTVYMEGVRS